MSVLACFLPTKQTRGVAAKYMGSADRLLLNAYNTSAIQQTMVQTIVCYAKCVKTHSTNAASDPG
jgi:hypothetical protein